MSEKDIRLNAEGIKGEPRELAGGGAEATLNGPLAGFIHAGACG